jgi:hypothetical protein
LLTNAW